MIYTYPKDYFDFKDIMTPHVSKIRLENYININFTLTYNETYNHFILFSIYCSDQYRMYPCKPDFRYGRRLGQ